MKAMHILASLALMLQLSTACAQGALTLADEEAAVRKVIVEMTEGFNRHDARASMSALRHAHAKQDEFVYVLQGNPTLHTNEGAKTLSPGMCAGFPAGTGNAHHLVNDTSEDVVYLEIGDRTTGYSSVRPDDDLQVVEIEGKKRTAHHDGTPY